MANELIRTRHGAQLLFADHGGDFSGSPATATNSLLAGSSIAVQIDLTGLSDGAARQSAKTGSLWGGTGGDEAPLAYMLGACLEFASAPTEPGQVDFFWAPSPSSTAGNGNPGGVSGLDSAFTITAGILGQLTRIGSLPVRANAINIKGDVGLLIPHHQYGSLIVANNAGVAFRSAAPAMAETHCVLTPQTIRPSA